MSPKNTGSQMKHRHSQLAIHRRAQLSQALLDVGNRGISNSMGSERQGYDFSLMFGPGGAMFLPENPPNNAQPSQSQSQPQSPQASLQPDATSSSTQSQPSASTLSSSLQASASSVPQSSSMASVPPTAAASTRFATPTPSPQTSRDTSSSQPQSQSQSQSQTSSAAVSYPETSTLLVSQTLSCAMLP